MDVAASLESDSQSAELVEPTDRALNDPTIDAETTSMLLATCGDPRLDATVEKRFSVERRVIGAIGEELIEAVTRCTDLAGDLRDGIDQRQEFVDVVYIRRGQPDRDWNPIPVGQDVML